MEEYNSKYFETPFRMKENFYESICTTNDRSYINTSYEEKRNFNTPKKFHSEKNIDLLNEAPKKIIPYEKKCRSELEPLNVELFTDEDPDSYEEGFSPDYLKIQKINGALFYYKMENIFILQGFLEWLISFEDIRDIMSEIVKSFIIGFNEKSKLLSKYFNKGTFLEIIGIDLNNIHTTLSILDNNIKEFSDDFEKSQFEAKDEKIYVSVQGKCYDHSNTLHRYIISFKFTLVLDLLILREALIKDVLRCDYIKVKVFN